MGNEPMSGSERDSVLLLVGELTKLESCLPRGTIERQDVGDAIRHIELAIENAEKILKHRETLQRIKVVK